MVNEPDIKQRMAASKAARRHQEPLEGWPFKAWHVGVVVVLLFLGALVLR